MHLKHELGSMKLGLEAIRELDASLGFPSRAFPSIHIAGTNGKGSVATKIAYSLELAGKKVGLFTSPHIACITERIQINGKRISLEDLERLSLPGLSYFETVTLAAFAYFAEQKVDIAVIEVGLGGRLDATNIITPLLSVITSIDYDHQEFLGDTLEEIAREKAGIIKPGVPVVLGPRVVPRKCFPRGEFVETRGSYEEENRAIAKRALEILRVPPLGIEKTPPCRFQRFGRIILDGAHNPAGIKRTIERIDEPFVAVAAFSKNPEEMIEALKPAEKIFWTSVEHERVIQKELPFEQAFDQAYALGKTVLVTGTLFMMQNALKAVERVSENSAL